MESKTAQPQDRCLSFLEKEVSSHEDKTCHRQLAAQLKAFLAINETNTEGIVHRMDDYAAVTKSSSDFDGRFNAQKELGEYLRYLYQLVFTSARLLPYDDSRQDMLVQLLTDSRTSDNEEDFVEAVNDHWTECYLSVDDEQNLGLDSQGLKERCDEWINFSSFLSRCFKAGLLDYSGGFKYPRFGIHDLLDWNDEPCDIWDAFVMVAAQWIIVNGPRMQENIFGYNAEQGTDRRTSEESWHAWTNKFKEVSDQAAHTPEINAAIKEAYDVMKGLDTLASDSIEEEKEDPPTNGQVQGEEQD